MIELNFFISQKELKLFRFWRFRIKFKFMDLIIELKRIKKFLRERVNNLVLIDQFLN